MKKQDLFEAIEKFLIETVGCNAVHQEIISHDVLGVCGSCNIIVEIVTNITFTNLEQAKLASTRADYAYLAVLKKQKRFVSKLVEDDFLKKYKIGVLEVDVDNNHATVKLRAGFNRMARLRKFDIRTYIDPKQSASGDFSVTEHSFITNRVKTYLQSQKQTHNTLFEECGYQWRSIDEILRHCQHDHAMPKENVRSYLVATLQKKWHSEWCETKIEKRKRYFRYMD